MRCSCIASATSRSCTGPTKSGGGSCCPGAGNRGSGLEIGKSSYPLLALIHVPMTIPAPDPRSSGRRALANPESRIPNPGPMQLTLERPDYDFFLRGADGASALVNERKLERSFVISPRALVEDWPVADVAAMAPADLQPLFELEPELILLGSGETQAFPPAETMAACLSQGIGLETMPHAAAARTFNVPARPRRAAEGPRGGDSW